MQDAEELSQRQEDRVDRRCGSEGQARWVFVVGLVWEGVRFPTYLALVTVEMSPGDHYYYSLP